MKRFLTLLTITLTCLSLFAAAPVEAKRFGGGGSFGKQRSMTPQPAPRAPTAAPAPAQGASKPGNKWLGPLAGLAIGAGLGALFASMGLGEGMGTVLMIVLAVVAVMFLVNMLRRKSQPALQYAGMNSPGAGTQTTPMSAAVPGTSTAPAAANIPADFPVESFLRGAKTTFIRLQAANDRKDLDDIREYTTPEMFAEIAMQLNERGDAAQKTDVLAIDTTLLEVAYEGDYAVASVRMSASLRENGGAPESVDEIWHVTKHLQDDKSVWLLAGIQQTSVH